MNRFVWPLQVICVCLVAVLLTGCANTRGGKIPYDVATFGAPDEPKPVVADETYKLAPLDTLTITIFQVADLSHDYTIDLSGNLNMPLIGTVHAVGMGTDELAKTIEQRLGAKYLQDPDVTVALKDSERRNVTLEGSVKQPGVYPVNGPLTLVQAVAKAGGATDYANPRRIAIFRTIDGKRMAAAFDLVSIRRGEAKDPDVYPGDIIVMDGSTVRAAQRDIMQSIPLFALFVPIL